MELRIDLETIGDEVRLVEEISKRTDNMDCKRVCHLFLDLFVDEYDETRDNIDRDERHSIAGHMNDPSIMQTLAHSNES